MDYALICCFCIAFLSVLTEGSHIPNMSKEQLLKIINCISESKDTEACHEFHRCNRMMPDDIYNRLKYCEKKYHAEDKCVQGKKMFSSTSLPPKIFDCKSEKFPHVEGEKRKKMMKFENCAKKVHKKCKLPQYQ